EKDKKLPFRADIPRKSSGVHETGYGLHPARGHSGPGHGAARASVTAGGAGPWHLESDRASRDVAIAAADSRRARSATAMKPLIPSLLGLVLAASAAACGPQRVKVVEPKPVNPSVAIVGATLWDGTGHAPVPNAVPLVRGDRILCAG